MNARLEQLLQLDGHETVLAIGAVVGHEIQMVTGLLELVFENDDVLVTEANDHIRLDTCFFKRLCGRICDCTTDAAANYAHALFAFNVRRLTEWADKVLNIIALVQTAKHFGGQANLLENDRNRPLLAVITRNRQRHTLRFLVYTENDKLTGLCLAGNERSFNLHIRYGSVQFLLAHDFVHNLFIPSNHQ